MLKNKLLFLQQVAVLFIASMLVSCASILPSVGPLSVRHAPPGKEYIPWHVRAAKLRTLHTWRVQGSLGVHAHAHKGVNLSFIWEQASNDYRLVLFGPFNQPYIEVVGSATGAVFRMGGKTYTFNEAEALLKQQLGIHFPLRCFPDWLLGLPASHRRSERVLNGTNHLLKLHQAGWLVRYLRYNRIRYMDLPTQLLMTQGNWYVRVIITHWKI